MPARRWAALAWPLAALAAVCGLDAVLASGPWPVPVEGLLDEPAHLLTAALVLAGLPASVRGRWLPWAVLGSVAIDVDHIPLFLWGEPVANPGSRPVTHSLVTVAVLLLVALVVTQRRRPIPLGLAAGVVLHLLRDLAGNPGVPLLWPASPDDVALPYAVYAVGLAVVTALAVDRRRRELPAVSRTTGG